MFVAAIIILSSLSCRVPFDFLVDMTIIPTLITTAVIIGLYLYKGHSGRRIPKNKD